MKQISRMSLSHYLICLLDMLPTKAFRQNLPYRPFLWVGCGLVCLFASFKAPQRPTFTAGEDPKPDGKEWVMVKNLSDEFNGSKLNKKKWTNDPAYLWTHPETGIEHNRGWYGSNRSLFEADNATVTQGELRLEAEMFESPRHAIKDNVNKPATRKYGGAMVRAKAAALPGYYMEAQIQASTTAMSCAYWLTTEQAPCEYLPQQERLELDILECVGRMTGSVEDDWSQDDWAISTHWDRIFHFNTWRHPNPTCGYKGVWNEKQNKYKGAQKGGKVTLKAQNADEFHIYGCYWHPNGEKIDFFLDGMLVKTVVPDIPFQSPMYLKLSSNFYDWIKEIDRESMGFNESLVDRCSKVRWIRTWKLE